MNNKIYSGYLYLWNNTICDSKEIEYLISSPPSNTNYERKTKKISPMQIQYG